MIKKHCDACDRVMEGNLLAKVALIAIAGWTGTVTVGTRNPRDNSEPDLCRACETLVAEAFVTEMKRSL
jgi:hypothetical protein